MTRKFAGADGIRGFACLIVLCVHAVAMFFNSTFMALTGMGKVGVWLFFVLSAFLLTAKFQNSGFGVLQICNYALGRALRILPIFVVACALYYFLGTAGIDTVEDLRNAVLFRVGYAHLWTIPVEFKFYAFLPLIAFLVIYSCDKFGLAGASVVTVFLVAVQQYAWPFYMTPESSISTHWYLSCFTLGCASAVWYRSISGRITSTWATLIALSAVVAVVMFAPIVRNILFGAQMDKWTQNKHLFIGAIWCLFMLSLMDGVGPIGSMMKSKFMVLIGKYSFSIYLMHWLIYMTLARKYPNSFIWMFVAFAVAILVGAIMYHMIEAPIERFRHRIQLRSRVAQSTSA